MKPFDFYRWELNTPNIGLFQVCYISAYPVIKYNNHRQFIVELNALASRENSHCLYQSFYVSLADNLTVQDSSWLETYIKWWHTSVLVERRIQTYYL